MADLKISEMTLLEELIGNELIPAVDASGNVALTPALILGLLQPAEPYVDEEDLGRDGLMSALDKAALDTALQPDDVGTAATAAATDFATAAQGTLADTALQPAQISTVEIVDGAISTPLDGAHRVLQLTADVASGWSAPLPAGADASAQTYWASLDILPPASGGPFALSIPAGWFQAGPLDTIALAAGDDPISITLRTWGAADIAYSAGWVTA